MLLISIQRNCKSHPFLDSVVKSRHIVFLLGRSFLLQKLFYMAFLSFLASSQHCK